MGTVNEWIKERHAERDRRDAEQTEWGKEALSKLYQLEFFITNCDNCGGHRQTRYVEVEIDLKTENEWVDSLNLTSDRQSVLERWLREDVAKEEELLAEATKVGNVMTREEFIASLDLNSAAEEFRRKTYEPDILKRSWAELAPGAHNRWMKRTQDVLDAALGKDTT